MESDDTGSVNEFADGKSHEGISSLGSLNNQVGKDIADYIAEEKITQVQKSDKRRILWQISIFTMCFCIIQLVSFRDHLVIDVDKETPNSISAMSVSIFQGIGFMIIGNLYDNVRMPKRLTFILLTILAVLTTWVRF